MEKFRNKYRIHSHRMPQWDYSGNGVYFITIAIIIFFNRIITTISYGMMQNINE
ncbi:MAG: hypothetical protein JW798_18215 [Prolixibacteraceae bacterium]|nr:hypothetical protein [Prolixibacteraceae bacterium]